MDNGRVAVCCNICKEDNARLHGRKGDFNIVQCQRCGLVYVNPRGNTDLTEAYADREWHRDYYIRRASKDRPVFQWLVGQLSRLKAKGRILDIGCGIGIFLAVAKEQGWNTVGIELNRWSSAYARQQYALNVVTGMFEEADFPSGSFDAIALIHTLEHLPDPLSALEKAYELLDEAGVLVVQVPNLNHPRMIAWRMLRGRNDAPDFLPRVHLYYFTPKTLTRLLIKAGFTIVDVKCGILAAKYGRRLIERHQIIGSVLLPLFHAIDLLLDAFQVGGLVVFAKKMIN